MLNKALTLILLFLMISCATSDLKINSDPSGAKVYLKSEKEKTEVGVTPMVLDSQYKNQKAYQFVIEKEGFHPQTVVFEKRSLSAEAEVFAHLKKIESSFASGGMSEGQIQLELQKVTRKVASIQSELIKKNYNSAENLSKDLLTDYPYSAVGWNLLGNAYYLQNKQSDALAAYKKALEFEPENQDTSNLIKLIENTPSRGDR